MIERRRLLAIGALAAAWAAAASSVPVQCMLAGAAIGGLGLPHGASDLAVVVPGRRKSFLFAYVATIGAVAGMWQVAPALGLILLLVLSSVHFALDVPDGTDPLAAWGWGLLLVGGPAILHRHDLTSLFSLLIGSVTVAPQVSRALQDAGLVGGVLIAVRWLQGRTPLREPTRAALAALVVLPPLLGFSAGFVLVHAWPQLEERRRQLGCATLGTYLRRTAPILAGATAVVGGIAALFATHPAAPATILFAAIAALATPHMLVTPLWRRTEMDTRAAYA